MLSGCRDLAKFRFARISIAMFFGFQGYQLAIADSSRSSAINHPVSVAIEPSLEGYGIQDVLSLLRDRRRVEDIIAALPAYLLSNVLIIKAGESRSLQRAGQRYILHSQSADFFLAYSDFDPTIELIKFHRTSGLYEFRRIFFPEDAGQAGEPDPGTTNPNECRGCHTSQLRPNFGLYPDWQEFMAGSAASAAVTSLEHQALEAFVRIKDNDPRTAPLNGQALLRQTRSPTSDLADSLGLQKPIYFAATLTATPEYQRFRYAIAAAISSCPEIASYIPNAVIPGGEDRLKALGADAFANLEPDPSRNPMSPDRGGKLQNIVGGLRYILESRNISTRHLSYSMHGPFDITEEAENKRYYPKTLFELQSFDSDAGLREDIDKWGAAVLRCYGNRSPRECFERDEEMKASFCSSLKDRSLQAFEPSR